MPDGHKKKLRVLMMGNLAPYRIGGAEVQTRRLAESLALRGHTVTVGGYANPNQPIFIKQSSAARINSHHLPVLKPNRMVRALSFSISMIRFLVRHAPNHDILFGSILGESALVAAFAKQIGLLKIPMVIKSAGAGQTGDAAFLRSLPGTQYLTMLLKKTCSKIIVISPQIEKELRSLGFVPESLVTIPNILPLPKNKSDSQRLFNGAPRFLYVGRMIPQKGVSFFLKALKQLNLQGYGPEADLIGDGPNLSGFQEEARRLNLSPAPVFHGRIQPDRVRAFYEKDAVFVLPSLYEGQPNVLLEAMSSGLPVIVTRSGGSEYLVSEKTGFVCPPGDTEALARAMRGMLDLPGRKLTAMGNAARQYVHDHFEVNKVIGQYTALFRSLIAGPCAISPLNGNGE